ncbi:DsbA family protein [Desulfotalea psychrophila]|uniref:Related to 27kDa outer membrane protein n=1 Tax=Desulfotalea psychrophila (strain LSv54 / DSM 12343) TaxID=177439 RepID=Q6AMT9_DESPS|nr:thioredoxin domain-containing protein [Desulfotalea psychrophila]CAG36336.1 related to 27kDa outer membrane protein [Desulfotalea psychrophila LSv54]
MKFSKLTILAAGAISLLMASTFIQAGEKTSQGQEGKVEWTLAQNWKAPAGVLDFAHSLDDKYVYFLTKEHKVMVYSREGKLQGFIPVAPGVSSIDIAPQGEIIYLLDSTNNVFSAVRTDFVVEFNTKGSPFKGKADAPVTIAVFTDFECPYCSKLVPLIDQIYEANSKNVKIVFKNMPLNFHKAAEPAARAGLAAEAQGKFWPYHDKIFAIKNLKRSDLIKTAKELELDIPLFKKDMDSNAVRAQVRQDIIDAKSAGVTGTPTVFINGHKLKQREQRTFQTMIDAELRKAGLL